MCYKWVNNFLAATERGPVSLFTWPCMRDIPVRRLVVAALNHLWRSCRVGCWFRASRSGADALLFLSTTAATACRISSREGILVTDTLVERGLGGRCRNGSNGRENTRSYCTPFWQMTAWQVRTAHVPQRNACACNAVQGTCAPSLTSPLLCQAPFQGQ